MRRATEASEPIGTLRTVFLSTLSLRRATSQQPAGTTSTIYFYPRSPCGERQWIPSYSPMRCYFYPRSPCGERLSALHNIFKLFAISIHALLAESDNTIFLMICQERHFYPRSPCGERPLQSAATDKWDNFYPRSPCGERPVVGLTVIVGLQFLSTLSLRRATNIG